MIIEASRGLPTSCYSCLMYDESSSPYNPDVRPEPDDPRILLGYPLERNATDRIHKELFGTNAPNNSYFGDDYVVRAEAYFLLGPSANAPEILAAMTERIAVSRESARDAYTYRDVVEVILDRGGYTWVTDNVSPDDQVFVAIYAFSACLKTMPTIFSDPLVSNFQAQLDGWRFSGFQGSLRQYLEDNWQP